MPDRSPVRQHLMHLFDQYILAPLWAVLTTPIVAFIIFVVYAIGAVFVPIGRLTMYTSTVIRAAILIVAYLCYIPTSMIGVQLFLSAAFLFILAITHEQHRALAAVAGFLAFYGGIILTLYIVRHSFKCGLIIYTTVPLSCNGATVFVCVFDAIYKMGTAWVSDLYTGTCSYQ